MHKNHKNSETSLFSLGVAQGVRAEKEIGSLMPGQLADFNIWSAEASFTDHSVDKFKVLSSYVSGEKVANFA